MSRGLYRFYLYFVAISLAESIVVSLGALLYQAILFTPLSGRSVESQPYLNPPLDTTALNQALIQFIVTLLIAGGFGALHYWLIRRDSASDPNANESGVRSFLLNWYLAEATLTAIIAGVIALEQVGQRYNSNLALPLSIALAALVFALALEFERRRLTPTRGAALVFERLRRHGVPFIILLSVVVFTLYYGAYQLERVIGHQLGTYVCSSPLDPTFYPTCVGDEVTGALLGAVVAVAPWLWLLWLGRRDARSQMRQVFLLLGWVIGGMIFLTIALQEAIEYGLRLATPDGDVSKPGYFNQFDFAPSVVVGVVALAVYGWILLTRAEGAMSRETIRLTLRALAGLVLAAPFWYGVYSALLLVAGMIGPSPQTPFLTAWDHPVALMIAGVAYIPLAFWLGAGSRAWAINGPRRGFVLGLLAAGALVTASAAVSLLYALLTGLLSVAQPDSLAMARSAGAALLTGLTLGGLYLAIAVRERQFAGASRAPEAAPPVAAPVAPATPDTPTAPMTPSAPAAPAAAGLDEALAQLESGLISREAAAARIRELARAGAL